MNAAEVVDAARVVGVHLTVDGVDILVDDEPSADLINGIKANKVEAIALLSAWDAEDWWVNFD